MMSAPTNILKSKPPGHGMSGRFLDSFAAAKGYDHDVYLYHPAPTFKAH